METSGVSESAGSPVDVARLSASGVVVGVGGFVFDGCGISEGSTSSAGCVMVGVPVASLSSSNITPFASNVRAIAVGIYSVGITVGRAGLVGKVHPEINPIRNENDNNRRELFIIKINKCRFK